MPYAFSPPTVNDVAQVPMVRDPRYRYDPLAYRARRHYGPNPRGRTVLKIAGAYVTLDNPTQTQIASASEVYMGGHIYEVSDAVATALVNAGYGITQPALLTESGFPLLTEDGRILLTEVPL